MSAEARAEEAFRMAQAAFNALEKHDAVCDERWRNLDEKLTQSAKDRGDMRREIRQYLVGVVLALAGMTATLLVTYVLPHAH